MAKKDFTLTSKILMGLLAATDASSYFIGTPYSILKTWEGRNRDSRWLVYHLYKRGLIKIIDKDNERFVRLTKNGELEALFLKARLPKQPTKWDSKWRLIFFDIPEASSPKRKQIRKLLKIHGFLKIQASVYISPCQLDRDVIAYLKKSKLIKYIRIARIDELDDDSKLRKNFKLK